MSTKPFRIVHLSDLHLTASDSDARSEPKLLGRLKGMNQAFRKIIGSRPVQEADLLLVTGDITDRGDLATWKVFWDGIRNAGLGDRTRVIPGNHDVCHLGLGISLFDGEEDGRIREMKRGLRLGKQATRFPWVHQPRKDVAIFGLNSNNMDNRNVLDNAVGHLDHFQLQSLASRLHKHREVPVKIVALHHSPNIPGEDVSARLGHEPMSKWERLSMQIDQHQRRALRLVCIAQGVRLIVHGHVHTAEDRRVGGLRIVGAPASTEPIDTGKYRFNTYTVTGKKPIVRVIENVIAV